MLRGTQCNWKSEIQAGGCNTGSTYNSAYMQDSNENSSGTPMFSGARNSMVLLEIHYPCNRSSIMQDGGR